MSIIKYKCAFYLTQETVVIPSTYITAMDQLIMKGLFLVLYIGIIIVQTPHRIRNRKNSIIVDKKNILELIIRVSFLAGIALIPMLYIFTSILNFANYNLPIWVSLLGSLLIIPTIWLFYRSHQDLGKNWSDSLEIRDNHKLVTTGIYNYIRHPMYSSIWLLCITQSLLLSNFIAGFSGLALFTIAYLLRVMKEESMMIDQFGKEYEEYMARTKRLLPNLNQL